MDKGIYDTFDLTKGSDTGSNKNGQATSKYGRELFDQYVDKALAHQLEFGEPADTDDASTEQEQRDKQKADLQSILDQANASNKAEADKPAPQQYQTTKMNKRKGSRPKANMQASILAGETGSLSGRKTKQRRESQVEQVSSILGSASTLGT